MTTTVTFELSRIVPMTPERAWQRRAPVAAWIAQRLFTVALGRMARTSRDSIGKRGFGA